VDQNKFLSEKAMQVRMPPALQKKKDSGKNVQAGKAGVKTNQGCEMSLLSQIIRAETEILDHTAIKSFLWEQGGWGTSSTNLRARIKKKSRENGEEMSKRDHRKKTYFSRKIVQHQQGGKYNFL